MILDSLTTASLFIPRIVAYSFRYSELSPLQQNAIINSIGSDSQGTTLKGLLFYSDLIAIPNIVTNYDIWNYIPLTYSEIETFVYYANTLDTQLKEKIELYPNSQTLVYLP